MNGPETFLTRKPSALTSPLGASGKENPNQAFNFDHEVFVIWRPWESCKRCWYALDQKELTLPVDGDFVCPHTRIKEYKELLAKRSQGLCEFPSYEATTLKNGVIQVSIMIASRRQKETATEDKPNKGGISAPPRPPVL